MYYADHQFQLWNASLEEAADSFQDLNVTAADLAGVDSYIVADTILGGEHPTGWGSACCVLAVSAGMAQYACLMAKLALGCSRVLISKGAGP